jgi:uncharacterized protein (TIGR02452 family)
VLHINPCLDSNEMAQARRLELGVPRQVAADLGKSAVEAITRGYYICRDCTRIEWGPHVQAAKSSKVSIPPDRALPERGAASSFESHVQVTNETTLGAARRLVDSGLRPLALNFANGVHPGGGFLGGARAQEEVLCRSSALFATLKGDSMYAAHAKRTWPDSSDWAIYSPDVPVFRQDDGSEVMVPWLLSFITCAAPYAPAIGQVKSRYLMQQRIHRVLDIAGAYRYTTLVLGAWGCGAFGNDPHHTAADFRNALENEFSGAFSDVVFAITDWSSERRFLGPFRDEFLK